LSKVPNWLHCPACGRRINTEEITDKKDLEIIMNAGFIGGARFLCDCGVLGAIYMKKMPESPTWTITFDKYKLGKEGWKAVLPQRGGG